GVGMTVAHDVGTRLRRLLAILTWLAQVGETPIDEAATRFGLEPDALVAELELAACCGLPPYTPDQLMEIVVTDTTVSAHLGEMLARPRRLSAREGFALAASGRALLAVPGSDGNGALSRALAKLDRALGGQSMVIELDDPSMLDVVRQALEMGHQLQIEYYSASSDEVSSRRIDPLRLFAGDGHWYVDAHCYKAGDERRFRVDRIQAAEILGPMDSESRAIATGTEAVEYEPFVPGPDIRTVRLALDPSVAWVVESIPAVTPPDLSGDRIEVDVAVGGDAWLKRLLLRLGTAAQVVGPPEAAALLGDAAGQILERYRRTQPG
ncbi:MAG TPA: WYL domain-containing protein, partial [Acidimicrobiales bacterium]|nr:WYL domain-containing protein [Acidimicrobiales bacterium]